ncbi:MAG: hypothetical protein OXE98_09130 [Hyphomicrobiales bacterium]|nr:hypothetical protein [Hyphomicrobiales bacterium]
MKKGVENMGKTGKEERTAHNAKKPLGTDWRPTEREVCRRLLWQAFTTPLLASPTPRSGKNAESRSQSQWWRKNQLPKTKAWDKALKYARKVA